MMRTGKCSFLWKKEHYLTVVYFLFFIYLGVKFHFVNPSAEELHLYLAPEFNLGNLGKAT